MELLEKWQGQVLSVTVGATKAEQGTRASSVTLGGETSLPFLSREGAFPHKPAIAFEIWDSAPQDWPEELSRIYSSVAGNTIEWAQKCVKEFGAELLCLRLAGAHPDAGNAGPEKEAALVAKLLKSVSVPLVILGCGDDTADNRVLPACSEASRGERCLIGNVVQDNYKTLTAAVLADGHSIIAESPIDVNIAKQLAILISDFGLPPERIVMDPTIGALGYGLEYAYSIMERARLSALSGDRMLALPIICQAGQEAWKAKEATVSVKEFPSFGSEKERGILWEALTATALLQAGADLLVMRHPTAVEHVREYIKGLTAGR